MPNLYDCLTRADDYDWGGRVDTPRGPYYHHDRGCKVLGVAHLDTVLTAEPIKEGTVIFAPQLDDRLGVYCLLEWLPRMGIQLDILLTTGEEKCNTTGAHFQGDYNWVIEFDRAGVDVVFYQYHAEFAPFWSGKKGRGSFSDIADMDYLGVCAANIGIGYHAQHTKNCYADLQDTEKQLLRFAKFFDRFQYTRFPFAGCTVQRASRKRRKTARVELPCQTDWDYAGDYDAWLGKSDDEWTHWDDMAKLHAMYN
jgi:hypothetical protein